MQSLIHYQAQPNRYKIAGKDGLRPECEMCNKISDITILVQKFTYIRCGGDFENKRKGQWPTATSEQRVILDEKYQCRACRYKTAAPTERLVEFEMWLIHSESTPADLVHPNPYIRNEAQRRCLA